MELTKREKEILVYLANGLVAKQIAPKMEISHRTVESHYVLMKAKMGAKTLMELIHIAHQKKIIQ